MKKAIGTILFVIYAIISITVTVLLLSYNEYNCSEIGGYTVFVVKDDSLEPEYKEGSILLIKGTSDKHIQIGDEIFLYKVINSQEYEFVNRKLVEKTQQGRHIVYQVENGETYDSTYFVGRAEDTIVINGWGRLLAFLESRWGYLFCVVVVSLLLFLQEVFDLIIELKYGSANRTKTTNVENARKNGASKKVTAIAKPASTTTKGTTSKSASTPKAKATPKKVAEVEKIEAMAEAKAEVESVAKSEE